MKTLLTKPSIHRVVLLIAIAIALGITVHEIFLVIAQILAIGLCAYLMVATIHQRVHRLAWRHL